MTSLQQPGFGQVLPQVVWLQVYQESCFGQSLTASSHPFAVFVRQSAAAAPTFSRHVQWRFAHATHSGRGAVDVPLEPLELAPLEPLELLDDVPELPLDVLPFDDDSPLDDPPPNGVPRVGPPLLDVSPLDELVPSPLPSPLLPVTGVLLQAASRAIAPEPKRSEKRSGVEEKEKIIARGVAPPDRRATFHAFPRYARSSMHCLAVCELGAPLEREEEALASLLGITAYDVRIRLGGVLPKVMGQFDEAGVAVQVADRVRARGHGAVVFDADAVTPLARMTLMRRFDAVGDRLFANDKKPPGVVLSDIVAIVHAALDVRVQRTSREITYRATTRGTIREEDQHRSTEHATEMVALLYFREGPPWLMRQSEARYVALGSQVRPTVHENFQLAIEWLRARAQNAVYDDRFARRPLRPDKPVEVRDSDTARALSSDKSVEQTIHALGTWLGRGRGGPYRG